MKNNVCFYSKDLNFGLFYKELAEFCKMNGTTFSKISREKLLYDSHYLSQCISNKRIRKSVFYALCEMMGVPANRYKAGLLPEPEKAPEPARWTCEVQVDEDNGKLLCTIKHKGETVSQGGSYLYSADMLGILRGIAYATNICFKNLQQREIIQQSWNEGKNQGK